MLAIMNLKYQLQHGMKNLNYLTYDILCQIPKVIFNISDSNSDNSSIKIYFNKIEDLITFEIKVGILS